jgi:hypothetical protein
MNTDIEELLREGMARYAADGPASAGMAARVRRARAGRRRVSRAALAAGTAAAAVGAAVAVTGGPASAPRLETAAYVVGHAKASLASAGVGSVLVARQTDGVTSYRFVAYGDRIRTRMYESGRLVLDSSNRGLRGGAGTGQQLTVDYQSRTWSRVMKGSGVPGHGTRPGGPSGCSPGGAGDVASAAYIRATLACGGFRITGHAVVDGVRAIKLAGTPRLSATPGREVIYVSASTYLPVRMVQLGVRYSVPPVTRTVTEDFRWLPPTKANRALLTVPVPAGFRRLPAKPGSSGN